MAKVVVLKSEPDVSTDSTIYHEELSKCVAALPLSLLIDETKISEMMILQSWQASGP